jgi:hypothetical protein
MIGRISNMPFTVFRKEDAGNTVDGSVVPVQVYDIKYDSNGYPHFLIYDYETRAWLFKKAKHFIPEEYDEMDEIFHPLIPWD